MEFSGPNQQASSPPPSSPRDDPNGHPSSLVPGGDSANRISHPNAHPGGSSGHDANHNNIYSVGESIQHTNQTYASHAESSTYHSNYPTNHPNAQPVASPGPYMSSPNAYPAGWPKPAYRQPLVDVDNLPELVTQPPSYFHHDDKDQDEDLEGSANRTGRQTASSARERLSQILPSKPVNRRFAYFVVPILILLLVTGAVLGGLFGSGVLQQKDSGTSDASAQEHSLDGDSNVEIRATSQLAAAVVGTSVSSFTLVLFQNDDGELAAIEWQGSKGDVYLLKNRFGDAKPPKPMEHSPFHTVTLGPSGDLHVFYFDDALRPAHIVRRVKNKEPVSWERGSLVVSSQPDLIPSTTLGLSVTSFSSDWPGMEEGCIVLVYHTNAANDSLAFVTSTQPDDPQSWTAHSFSLGVGDIDLQLHPESPGLLVMPFKRRGSPGLRIIWDVDNSSHKSTFGILDCFFTKTRELAKCNTVSNQWEDTAAEEQVLEMAKPLRLASLRVETDDDDKTQWPADRYVVRVLDSHGSLTELLWRRNKWTSHLAVTNETATFPSSGGGNGTTANFTSIASPNDGLLYAVSGGKLLEFSRETAWWTQADNEIKEVPAWKFLDEVDTKLSEN
ncbi:unnamed protein product [Clonostachys rhizophaga]|uniref:Fucose-specific lectin n=1 Tax=Clonostachys rhizophaga TaxID=160324 RepID=A0A9N9VQX7_9HYPO|nr:unnamed protein product [Clonostachys rhizophaga]